MQALTLHLGKNSIVAYVFVEQTHTGINNFKLLLFVNTGHTVSIEKGEKANIALTNFIKPYAVVNR